MRNDISALSPFHKLGSRGLSSDHFRARTLTFSPPLTIMLNRLLLIAETECGLGPAAVYF
jgi:hypothetical protein